MLLHHTSVTKHPFYFKRVQVYIIEHFLLTRKNFDDDDDEDDDYSINKSGVAWLALRLRNTMQALKIKCRQGIVYLQHNTIEDVRDRSPPS